MSHSLYNTTGAAKDAGQSRSALTSKCASTEASDEFYYCNHPGCTKKYSRYNAYMKHLQAPHKDNNTVGPSLIVSRTTINEPDARSSPLQQNSAAFNGEAFSRPAGPLPPQSATSTATVLAEEENRVPGLVSEGIPAHRDDEMSSANNPESVTDLVQRLTGHSSLATYITQILWCMLMDNDYWARYCSLTLHDHQWNTAPVQNLWPEPLPPDLECLISALRMRPNWPAIQRKFLQDHKGRQTPFYCWLH
jgi:hypothetical protein